MKNKKILSFILCLFIFTNLFTKGLFAKDTKTKSDTLNINQAIVGNIDEGYTSDVTVPTYFEENTTKPYKVYNITFYTSTSSGSLTNPSTITSGQFSNSSCTFVNTDEQQYTSCSIKYTANEDATVKGVETDLSAITYKGAGTLTISVLKDLNTSYYNGHYYKLINVEKTWKEAMSEMLSGDTESYRGYKGHPVTITSFGENKIIQDFQKNKPTCRIWIGGITNTANKDNSYTDGILNDIPGGEGTGAIATKGTGYKWIWGSPEGDNEDQTKNILPDNPTDYDDRFNKFWATNEPNANKGYVIYMGLGQAPYWDDLTESDLIGTSVFSKAYYVIEYSPIDDEGNWLYDENGNSETSNFNNPQIVSKTFTVDNIHTHTFENTWTSDETDHWHKCTKSECFKIADLNTHSGGTSTCVKGKICTTCNKEYGLLDSTNHSNLKHIEAKAPTTSSQGNIEYWYCDGCNKYYSNENADVEITKESTQIPILPSIIKGKNQSITVGDKKELSFSSNADINTFIRVELDNVILETNKYKKESGSTIITLNADYVSSLSVGTHTLSIVSINGKATAYFTVNKKEISSKAYSFKDKNQDGVISCEEEMDSANWIWSESKKACVYKVSNTNTK